MGVADIVVPGWSKSLHIVRNLTMTSRRTGATDRAALTKHTLTAAALQDHLSRQLLLTTQSHTPRAKAQCCRCGQERRSLHSSHLTLSSRHPAHHARHTTTTTLTSSHSSHPNFSYPHTSHPHTSPAEEQVLDTHPPLLTLAQRLGLHPSPPPLLTEQGWEGVRRRSDMRGDFTLPCPICQDHFRLRQQVLLSCSHTFHRACLQAFERHSRKKCCPLCRSEAYQSKLIHDGARHFRNQAATRIQAVWRGHLARRAVFVKRGCVPPHHPALRRRHFEQKLSSIAERLVRSCDECEWRVESVIADADAAMASSRKAMRCLEAQSEPQWQLLRERAREQSDTDCSICLTPLTHPNSSALTPSLPQRPTALLCCGHLFHLPCIEAFERFTPTPPHPLTLSTPHTCPLCRSPYLRQTV